jgi:hypothetical protein
MSVSRSIDLHGCTVPEAMRQFVDFYNDCVRSGYQGFIEVHPANRDLENGQSSAPGGIAGGVIRLGLFLRRASCGIAGRLGVEGGDTGKHDGGTVREFGDEGELAAHGFD